MDETQREVDISKLQVTMDNLIVRFSEVQKSVILLSDSVQKVSAQQMNNSFELKRILGNGHGDGEIQRLATAIKDNTTALDQAAKDRQGEILNLRSEIVLLKEKQFVCNRQEFINNLHTRLEKLENWRQYIAGILVVLCSIGTFILYEISSHVKFVP